MQQKSLKYYWSIEILGGADKDFSWLRLWRRVRRSRSANFLFWFRISQAFALSNNRFLKSIAKEINNKMIRRHGIEIMLGAEIGEGLRLSHMQGIVIFKTVRIGRNFTIRQNTTIGSDFKRAKPMVIGDNVDVGANSCIIGDGVVIGDDVVIGAMSFVNKDVPSGCVYVTEKTRRVTLKNF
jgi:serine O-acetyltransferase